MTPSDHSDAGNGPEPHAHKPRWVSWTLVAAGVLVGLVVLGAVAVARSASGFDARYAGRLIPDTRIEGVDVSGMRATEAVRAVRAAVAPKLNRRLTLVYGDRRWRLTFKELGMHADVRRAVRSALRASTRLSLSEKLRMRYLGEVERIRRNVSLAITPGEARRAVAAIAPRIERDPVDARLDISTGWVEILKGRSGRALLVDKTHKQVLRALRHGGRRVRLAVADRAPEVTRADFDQVLLVRLGDHRLHLYEDGVITHSYTVATGQPRYPTPSGIFEVTEKRYMPTWINPDPKGWGKKLPKEIPPGPENPLGTRAINWSAPAIRFHGTLAVGSLGYSASHGCVRMAMPDVEELFDLVEVGDPIVSL